MRFDWLSDDGLMAVIALGNLAAFDVLATRHTKMVLSLARRRLRDPALAEEARQDTFVRLWKLSSSYEAYGRFRPFLCQLCTNVCREHHRRRQRLQANHERYASEPHDRSVLEPQRTWLEERQRRLTVVQAVAKLPTTYREAVLLRFYEDLSYQEMAQILKVSEPTLRSRVFHGVKRLRAKLATPAAGALARLG